MKKVQKNCFIFVALLVSLFLLARAGSAEVKTVPFEYKDGGVILAGSYLYDDTVAVKRPVVLVFHDWMGPTDVTLDAAQKVVSDGYIAFIADIFGKGVRPASVKEASDQITIYKSDRALMRRRALAAYHAARNIPQADAAKVGSIGFCFGGTVALELARSGAQIAASVSFHGGLDTPNIEDAKAISGKVLALHGALDPFVPETDVSRFEKEMTEGKVDWQLVKFGGAVHAFTNKKVDELKLPGAAYNKNADERSFEYMKDFFASAL